MPRNSTGAYSRPAGTTPAPGDLIESSKYNDAINDLGAEITNSLPRTVTAPMFADLDHGGFKGINAADPVDAQDVATKAYVENRLTPKAFGAVGDGTTNDDTAFSNLEAAYTGQAVDLLGLTYLVTVEPRGNDYYNGGFLLSGDTIVRNRNPRGSQVENPAATVRETVIEEGVYRGLPAFIFQIDSNRSYIAWRRAPGHGNENPGTELFGYASEDGGFSPERPTGPGNSGPMPTRIYGDATSDTRNAVAGTMASGRMGILAARVLPAGTHIDPVFIYSDDNGVTWSNLTIPSLSAVAWNFHGALYEWPGGGANGFIAYFYNASGQIGYLTTNDNGLTWVEGTNIVAPGPYVSLSEMSVARVGTSNEWVMMLRGSAADNAAISTSADMTTWTTAVASNNFLGGNPPWIDYDDGRIYATSFSREGKPITKDAENALITSSVNAKALYADPTTSWTNWRVITELPFFPTGYLSGFRQFGGKWRYVLTIENYAGSTQSTTASVSILSSDTFLKAQRLKNHNLFLSGSLRNWPLGTSIVTAGRRTIVPGLTFARQSSVGGSTVSRQPGKFGPYAIRFARDDGDTQTQYLMACLTLSENDTKLFVGRQATLSMYASVGSGFSAASGFLTIQLRYHTEGYEQAVTGVSGTYPVGDTTLGTASSGITPTTEKQRFTLQPSRLPEDATQLMAKLFWTPSGTAADDYLELEQIEFTPGAELLRPFDLLPIYEETNQGDRFAQAFDVRAPAASTFWVPFSSRMHIIPTVTASTGTVSQISRDGFLLANAGAEATVNVEAYCIF